MPPCGRLTPDPADPHLGSGNGGRAAAGQDGPKAGRENRPGSSRAIEAAREQAVQVSAPPRQPRPQAPARPRHVGRSRAVKAVQPYTANGRGRQRCRPAVPCSLPLRPLIGRQPHGWRQGRPASVQSVHRQRTAWHREHCANGEQPERDERWFAFRPIHRRQQGLSSSGLNCRESLRVHRISGHGTRWAC